MGYCGDAHTRVAAPMENAMKKVTALVAILLAVSLPGSALAHMEHEDLAPLKTSDLQVELVKKTNGAIVYVKNRGEKFPTAGATGTLTVTNGSVKTDVPLQPAGGNAMKTKGNTKMVAGAKAQASITFADKNTVTADFVIK